MYDSLLKDSLPNGLVVLLPKCRQTPCRDVASCYSLTLPTFECLIDFNKSHSLILKRVKSMKMFYFLFKCKTLQTVNLVISTYCPSINCPSVRSLLTKNLLTISRRPCCSYGVQLILHCNYTLSDDEIVLVLVEVN